MRVEHRFDLAQGRLALAGRQALERARRAGAVKDELVRNGIPATAISVVGRGESDWLTTPTDYATPMYLAAGSAVIARCSLTCHCGFSSVVPAAAAALDIAFGIFFGGSELPASSV